MKSCFRTGCAVRPFEIWQDNYLSIYTTAKAATQLPNHPRIQVFDSRQPTTPQPFLTALCLPFTNALIVARQSPPVPSFSRFTVSRPHRYTAFCGSGLPLFPRASRGTSVSISGTTPARLLFFLVPPTYPIQFSIQDDALYPDTQAQDERQPLDLRTSVQADFLSHASLT